MAPYTLICVTFLVVFSVSAFEPALAGRPEPTSRYDTPLYPMSEPVRPPVMDMEGHSTRSMDQVVNPTYPNYPYSSGQGYGSGYPYSGQGYPYNGQGYPYSGQPYFPSYRFPPLFPTIGGPLPYGPNFPYSDGPGSYPSGSGSYPYWSGSNPYGPGLKPYGPGSYPYGSGSGSNPYGPPANGDAKARP